MNCRDVRNKLPDYLTDQCSTEEKLDISKHISICSECMRKLEQLEEPVLPMFKNEASLKPLDTGKLLSKARKALILKVTTTTMLCIFSLISIFFVIVPGILKAVRYPKINDITRSLVDITQFTSPTLVGGYGNTIASFGDYSFKLSAYTYQMTGTKQKGSGEVESKFNMFTGTYQSTVSPNVQFIHPSTSVSQEVLDRQSSAVAKRNLIKNGNNTVATVDISLKTLLSLDQLVAALKDLDVRVQWMAVECGGESFKPKNMSNDLNQYIQWGIPGQLFLQNRMGPPDFDYTSPSKYEKAVIEELKWLEENKHYLASDKSLLKFQGFDNSVGNKAKYIIDNGIKIYGLRITGPSTELSKLGDKLDIRMEEVKDVDFYYWK